MRIVILLSGLILLASCASHPGRQGLSIRRGGSKPLQSPEESWGNDYQRFVRSTAHNEHMVIGTIVGIEHFLDGPRYEERRSRHITARVETVLRGDAPVDSLITFDVPGGTVDGISTICHSCPVLRDGDRYLIVKSPSFPGSEYLRCGRAASCIWPMVGDSLVKVGNREVRLAQVLRDMEAEKWKLFPGTLAREADLVVMGTVLGMEMPWHPTRECPDSAAIQIHHVYQQRSGPKVRRGEILPLRLEAIDRQGMTWVMPAGSEMILMLERRDDAWVLPGPWHHALRLVGDEVWVENGGARRQARIARWNWREVDEALSAVDRR